MATKSLTHIFMLMRDKAVQRRNMFKNDELYSDHDALVLHEHMESGIGGRVTQSMPDWTSQVEEVHYNILTLKDKIKRLAALQNNLIRRPSFDDNSEEEKQLTNLHNEVRRSLERCQTLMMQIKMAGSGSREETLNRNVVRSLAASLQDLKNDFVNACSSYANSVNNIKKSSSFMNDTENDGQFDESSGSSDRKRSWTRDQLLFLEDNSMMVQERDRAVHNILKSTVELNVLFRDVAQLVQEQGTVLDRIDFTVENTSVKVEEGAKQLRQADKLQRKSRNMVCIASLAGAIVFLIILLVIVKSA